MNALMESYFQVPIQLGFDIATSLTIIGSLTYFVISMRKRIREERQQRFDKQVRGVAAEQLRTSISKLSDLFIHKLIAALAEYDSALRVNQNVSHLDREIEALKDPERFERVLELLSEMRAANGEFYEILSAERYNIIPVIDSIEDDSQLVREFLEQLFKIAAVHGEQGREIQLLIRELKDLSTQIEKLCAENNIASAEALIQNDEVRGQLMPLAASVVYDEKYYHWTKSFIDDEEHEAFLHSISNTTSLAEMEESDRSRFINICVSLIGQLQRNPHRLFAQVLILGRDRQQDANKCCKEVMVTLSAILKYLLMRDSDDTKLHQLVATYKSAEYFDLEHQRR